MGRVRRRLKGRRFHYTIGHPNGDGYLQVGLRRNRKTERQVLVHRLVVETFVRELREGEVCHHRSHCKTDNRLVNLQIMTKAEHDLETCCTRYGKKSLKRMRRSRRSTNVKKVMLLSPAETCVNP